MNRVKLNQDALFQHLLPQGREPDYDAQYQRLLDKQDEKHKVGRLIMYTVILAVFLGFVSFILTILIVIWLSGGTIPV